MENKNWVFIEGRFVEADIEHTKKTIQRTSVKTLEEVALKLFENYLRKL
jgi:uncharacterized membrane protein YcgQ (UPF0703/DUF1980 family)